MNLSTLCITLKNHHCFLHCSQATCSLFRVLSHMTWVMRHFRTAGKNAARGQKSRSKKSTTSTPSSKQQNCTHYYSPRVLLIYKNNMHKMIKTNSCFPKKNQKRKKWKFALWEENRGLTNY